jgi:3'(2'), 5'-bisphosphate nucleotidase
LQANELICRRLSETFPGVPVVAEESDPETFAAYRTAERIFFVDPLDGTAEFVDRNGEFVVMIGLVEGEAATIGVVAAPAKRLAWVGALGQGAWVVSEAGRTRIGVSDTASLSAARVVASRSHRSPSLERCLSRMGGRELATVGSAGLKGAEIASGRADVYLAPGRAGKRWDACAVDAIVSAAGGRYTDGSGKPFDYRADNLANETGLVATNGKLHGLVLDVLAELGV